MKPLLSKDEVCSKAVEIMKTSIENLAKSEYVQLDTKFNKDIATLGQSIQDSNKTDQWRNFSKGLLELLWPAIDSVSSSFEPECQEQMCTLYHTLSINGEADKLLATFVRDAEIVLQREAFVLQFLMEEYLKTVIEKRHGIGSQTLFTLDF